MSRGYRLFFATVAGFLAAAVALGFWLEPEPPHLANEQGFQEVSKSYHAGGSGCDPAKIRSLPIRLRQSKTDACTDAEEQFHAATNGIIEAKSAAIAANAQAIFAYKQTRIATWGGIIGGLTLIAAIGAAIFAERAAYHTGRSANAAFEGQRAWVTLNIEPKRVTRSAAGVDFDVDFLAKNIGQTTATHFCFKTELFFKGPFEDSESIIKNIDATIEEWKLDYTNSESVLIPQDTEINHFWKFIQSNQIVWHIGFPAGKDVAQPIFLAAVFYRTAARPDLVQQSWRSWYLSELDLGGHFTAFVGISFQPVEAENLSAKPFRVNLTHKEYHAP